MIKNHNTRRGYYFVAATFFLVVAILHAVRAGMQLPMIVGEFSLPLWISWVVFVLLGYLAFRGYYKAWQMRHGE